MAALTHQELGYVLLYELLWIVHGCWHHEVGPVEVRFAALLRLARLLDLEESCDEIVVEIVIVPKGEEVIDSTYK